jgi:hypothetical protein
VPFYVRLGPRGILFRIGTILVGFFGSAVYWRASRKRGKLLLRLPHFSGPLVKKARIPHNESIETG